METSLSFWNQPLSYPVLCVGYALLTYERAPPSETLRFIADAERARALVQDVLRTCDERPDSEDQDKWFLLWAVCSLDNIYLARAIFHGEELRYSPLAYTYQAIYFDLLFRHGMWAEAERCLYMPLSGDWTRDRIPEKHRDRLITGKGWGHLPDVAGFRYVWGYNMALVPHHIDWYVRRMLLIACCPYITAQQTADILEEVASGEGSYVRIALKVRGYPLDKGLTKRERHLISSVGAVREIAMAFVRESRRHDDLKPLVDLAKKLAHLCV